MEPPKKSKRDLAHTVVKAGLSAIPIAGGPAAELFQYVVQPPLERRREEWMKAVGEKLQELERQGLKLEDLQSNEPFISAVMHASQIALRTHEQAKLDALQNAVANVATGQAPEEALQHMYLSFINDLTELHLRVLKFFEAPPTQGNVMADALSHVLERGIPPLQGRRDIYDQLWRDLYSRGLVNTESLHVMMSGNGLGAKRTTNLGSGFLDFIANHPKR